MSETLKPCPFCGGAAVLEDYPADEGGLIEVWVHCGNGDCPVQCYAFGRDRNEVVTDWNRRAEPVGEDEVERVLLDLHRLDLKYHALRGSEYIVDMTITNAKALIRRLTRHPTKEDHDG